MELQWITENTFPEETISALANQLNLPPILARILYNRGIETFDDAKIFFRAGIESLHDPFLMADMEAAVDCVISALEAKKKVLIYGDYDVDGTTSTAVLIRFFQQIGYFVDYYIPNRVSEGYGLSIETVEAARQRGTDLIIAVDCGITALDEVKRARELGMDIVICDHHQPGLELPPANAVLDPKRSDCPFPFKELAGVGVTFKLVQAIAQRVGVDLESLRPLMDLVAIGSAADIVPLVDENRILTKVGLEQLNQTENLGLQALLQKSGLSGKRIGTGQIIFIIAPRINAVGRLGDASRAVDLLTTDHYATADAIASVLEKENRKRRDLDEGTFQQAIEMIETQFDPSNDAAFVLCSDNWHPGVIGIVASRIVEQYYRPTVMISLDDGIGKGSARSIPGFSIYEALENCSDLMQAFGGHKYAAGLSIHHDKIDALRDRLRTYAGSLLSGDMLTKKLNIEGEVRFREIDAKFMRLLKMMAPFGPQNMKPILMSRGVSVVGMPTIVGRNHLRLKLSQDGIVFDAIGFGLGGHLHRVRGNPQDIEVAYIIEENEWQGRVTIQLRLRDLR